MNGIGRLASDKKVNMIGHNFHIFYTFADKRDFNRSSTPFTSTFLLYFGQKTM